MVNKILEELDRMMDAQEREIEIDMETEDESKVYLETVRLLAYNEVARMIKKCAQEAASSEGTDVNTQEKYNTDQKKSEIRKLVVKIWENGFSAEQRPDYSTMLFLNNPNCMIEAWYLKEKLMGLLEERRGNDNGKDDSDHN